MSKYRAVPILSEFGYPHWKVQKEDEVLFGLMTFWRDLTLGQRLQSFARLEDAEDLISQELARAKSDAEHLAQPIKEYGE